MPRSSSCRARWIGWRSCAGTVDGGGGDRGTAAGVLADRAGLHPEADADAAGNAMAWAGTTDLLRAASDAADPDAGEGRPDQGTRRRRRRRAAARSAHDVAIVPRPKTPARPMEDRWAGLHLDLPGRDPLANLCGVRRLQPSVRRDRS